MGYLNLRNPTPPLSRVQYRRSWAVTVVLSSVWFAWIVYLCR